MRLVRGEELFDYLVEVLRLRLVALFRVRLRSLEMSLVARAPKLHLALDCELHPVAQIDRHRLRKVVRLDKLRN